jgi:hypothetical protein
MGLRFLIVIVAFISVNISSGYADTVDNNIATIDSVLNNIHSKVRKSKSCEDINKYLKLLNNLDKQDYLTQDHQERIDIIVKNQC